MSKGISRLVCDIAGSLILLPGAKTVFVNKKGVSVIGDFVGWHEKGPHRNSRMVGASTTVYAGGKRVVRQGDKASCGHAATGSKDVFAG